MSEDLEYAIGVSWPRSGHHLLVRILQNYFRKKFCYCSYYNSIDCCRAVPCIKSGFVNLSKNHDFISSIPILDNRIYIIQYREFSPAVISHFELYLRRSNRDNDTPSEFRSFAMKEAKTYVQFMKRWSSAIATNATFVRISYEQLTSSPVATLRPVINTFSPGLPCDENMLARSIQSAERITVKNRVEIFDPFRGVQATRDVQSFRFYDEALFRALDQLTRPAYDEIAELPVVTRTNGLKTRHGVTGVLEPKRGKEVKQLYVDATGALESVSNTFTGISRIEKFIVRRAIEDPDVHAITYDRQVQAFRNLTDAEKILLTIGPRLGLTKKRLKNTGKMRLFIAALHLAIENRPKANGIDSKSSENPTHPQPAQTNYSIFRTSKRIYRDCRKALDVARGPAASKCADIDDLANGILLTPTVTVTGSPVAQGLLAVGRRVFLCHESIILSDPKVHSGPAKVQLPTSHLMQLLETGAQVLCPSDASRAQLRKLAGELGTPTAKIGKFRPASTLYEKALSKSRISRFSPKEPFVLYYSPIDTHTNHLLLAKVWKQAHDEGVVLPKLVCAGKWGQGVVEFRAYLETHPHLKERIEFPGPVDDIELIDLYRSALFAVVPSITDGWDNVVSECLDFWLPVIVSTHPALTEAAQGLMPIVGPNDQEGWLAQVRRLSENKSDLADLTRSIDEYHQPVESQQSWNSITIAITENL